MYLHPWGRCDYHNDVSSCFIIVVQVLLEHRLKEMEVKFMEQVNRNQVLMREFELQTDRQRYMNKEYADLRQQLGQLTKS